MEVVWYRKQMLKMSPNLFDPSVFLKYGPLGMAFFLTVLVYLLIHLLADRKLKREVLFTAFKMFMAWAVAVLAFSVYISRQLPTLSKDPSEGQVQAQAPIDNSWQHTVMKTTGDGVAQWLSDKNMGRKPEDLIIAVEWPTDRIHIWWRGKSEGFEYCYKAGEPSDLANNSKERYFLNSNDRVFAGFGGRRGIPVPVYFRGEKVENNKTIDCHSI